MTKKSRTNEGHQVAEAVNDVIGIIRSGDAAQQLEFKLMEISFNDSLSLKQKEDALGIVCRLSSFQSQDYNHRQFYTPQVANVCQQYYQSFCEANNFTPNLLPTRQEAVSFTRASEERGVDHELDFLLALERSKSVEEFMGLLQPHIENQDKNFFDRLNKKGFEWEPEDLYKDTLLMFVSNLYEQGKPVTSQIVKDKTDELKQSQDRVDKAINTFFGFLADNNYDGIKTFSKEIINDEKLKVEEKREIFGYILYDGDIENYEKKDFFAEIKDHYEKKQTNEGALEIFNKFFKGHGVSSPSVSTLRNSAEQSNSKANESDSRFS